MSTKTPYIIYSESTPNPDVMKFVSNKTLTDKSIEYLKIEDTESNTLIRKSLVFLSLRKFSFLKIIFLLKSIRILIGLMSQINLGS